MNINKDLNKVNYKCKYVTYKKKYLELKKEQEGGFWGLFNKIPKCFYCNTEMKNDKLRCDECGKILPPIENRNINSISVNERKKVLNYLDSKKLNSISLTKIIKKHNDDNVIVRLILSKDIKLLEHASKRLKKNEQFIFDCIGMDPEANNISHGVENKFKTMLLSDFSRLLKKKESNSLIINLKTENDKIIPLELFYIAYSANLYDLINNAIHSFNPETVFNISLYLFDEESKQNILNTLDLIRFLVNNPVNHELKIINNRVIVKNPDNKK